ncbi:MAG: ABC transporter substrate-binding protein [Bacillota bacterium]|nr:ABC transporter substrate-binding protein [Bacillota bacterium]
MNNPYFDKNTKVYDIVTKYPATLDYLIGVGFTPLGNPKMLNTIGKVMTIGSGCALKGVDYDALEKNLLNLIEDRSSTDDVTLGLAKKTYEQPDFLMTGVLPCPIRISLQEAMQESSKINGIAEKAQFDLQSASMGIDHIKKAFDAERKLGPDIALSVGFEHFFGRKVKEELFESGDYIVRHPKMNERFDNQTISLRDPKGRYFILAVVPCVFLVNKKVLGDRKFDSWADLMKPEFEGSLSIPLGDLDMFNAICLNIYKEFGYEGIERLKKANAQSLHPAEMAGAFKKKNPPAISIVPYFFTKMVYNTTDIEVVWPKDGAIISPIFLIAKKDKQEEFDTIINFFKEENVDALLSANGKFPATLEGASYHLEEDQALKWVGWDFIDENDVDEILLECEKIFGIK